VLRVPVVKPFLFTVVDTGVATLAAALAGMSLFRVTGSVFAAVGMAAALAGAGALATTRRPAVTALRLASDGAVYLRLRAGWRPVELTHAWRGGRWLTLRGRLPAALCNTVTAAGANVTANVTFTLWRDALAAPAWRRSCVLIGRRLRRVAGRPRVEAS
jgi:hypothetical protein